MADSIENRGVQMTFDNASFEQKIAETIKSLDAFNKKLDFTTSQKNIGDLGKAANSLDLSGMTSAIENVSGKFIALSTIAITAIAQITSAALDAGVRIVKAFSLDPVLQGFQEYETNMNSIQTILANTDSKGTTLEQVNAALDQLNEYSDRTIYNFSEMARNIGTFTAAGVDLDVSVNAIKGIANLAAISGSNSQQASTAMYQLSQALASGTVKLMDWNSVVNAGMGGEVFQKALFETGKALGTIKDVPIDQSFDEWKEAGNSFRETLQDGWITADVLTNTLQAFTGDLTEAQLMSLGYTQEQAKEMARLGKLGNDAATEVKTLTQLISTVKESVASGWSQSFRIVFGTFEEAKELFTGINDAIGGFVANSADSRNAILQGWKDLGGRDLLIQGLKESFEALGKVLGVIKQAFQKIFPPVTTETLFKLTVAFAQFARALEPTDAQLRMIRSIFAGFFAALEIGWTVIKETINLFRELFSGVLDKFDGAGSGLARFANDIVRLNESLVAGGGIAKFFDDLKEKVASFVDSLKNPVEFLKDFTDKVVGLFTGFDVEGAGVVEAAVDRIGDRFSGLKDIFDRLQSIWEPFADALGKVVDVLDEIWNHIKTWFSELGANIAENIEEGDFEKVADLINIGLLGGIAAILTKFFKEGIKFDIGDGLFGNISKSFEELTGVLTAMQTNLKANALLKIAGAIGILTASVLVLSLIDSEALTKALTAMAVGFGQLMASFAILTKLSIGPTSSAMFVAMATGITILAGAILILSIAMKILSTMDWNELSRGMTAVTVLLTTMSTAAIVLSKNTGGLMRAGAGILLIAIAMNVLAVAMKIFATMSWEEIGKGLVGVAGGLGAIVLAMNLLPKGMVTKAVGIIVIAAAMNLLAAAMKIFATMSWEEIGKGIVAVAGGLVGIALAMQLMPITLPITAAGLVLVGIALNAIALATKSFAGLSWEEIGRGLAAMAGALVVLGLATTAMSGSILGAAAIAIVAVSLGLLFRVLQDFSKLKISDLLRGLLGIGIALGALAIAALAISPAIGALFALGAALLVLGAGFALFGVGASLVAKAFEVLAKAGEAGLSVFMALLDAIIERIPEFIKQVGQGLIDLAMVFLEAAPILLEALEEVLLQVLDTIIELSPKLAETLVVLITDGLEAIREIFPDVVQTAIDLVLALLEGLGKNIDELVAAASALIVAFLGAIGDHVDEVIAAGAKLIADILTGIGQAWQDIITAGADAIIAFLEGMASNILKVVEAGFQIVIEFLNGLADSIERNRGELAAAGLNLLDAIFGGVLSFATETVIPWFTGLPAAIVGWIGNVLTSLYWKGRDFIIGLYNGLSDKIQDVISWLTGLPTRLVNAVGDLLGKLWGAGWDLLEGLWRGLKAKAGEIYDWVENFAEEVVRKITHPWEIFSPSRRTKEIGEYFMEGLTIGLASEGAKAVTAVDNISSALNSALMLDEKGLTLPLQSTVAKTIQELNNIGAFTNPVITPVLDLSYIQQDAKKLQSLLTTDAAYSAANSIAATRLEVEEASEAGPSVVKYEQNIYSPTQLSTADIYRQTRNQIVLAKEELEVR